MTGTRNNLLLQSYLNELINNALAEETRGIKVNGVPINNVRYADRTILITTSLRNLQIMLNKVATASE